MPVEQNEAALVEQNRSVVGISNTYMKGGEWLAHAADDIKGITTGVRKIVVVPYALADMDWYGNKLGSAFARMGIDAWDSPHKHVGDETRVIEDAEAVYIGGGNTGRLVANLHSLRNADGSMVDKRPDAAQQALVAAIRKKVGEGMPLLGASAGLNVMAGDIRTTNDMHIAVQRLANESLVSRLDSLGVLPPHLSVNPHYIEKVVVSDEDRARAIEINEGLGKVIDHQGESRETRLKEVVEMDPERIIIALREGAYLVLNGKRMTIKGETGGLIFRHGEDQVEIATDEDLSDLLNAA